MNIWITIHLQVSFVKCTKLSSRAVLLQSSSDEHHCFIVKARKKGKKKKPDKFQLLSICSLHQKCLMVLVWGDLVMGYICFCHPTWYDRMAVSLLWLLETSFPLHHSNHNSNSQLGPTPLFVPMIQFTFPLITAHTETRLQEMVVSIEMHLKQGIWKMYMY